MLCQPLAPVYAQNSSILYWAVYNPIAFHNFEVSQGACSHSFKVGMAEIFHLYFSLHESVSL